MGKQLVAVVLGVSLCTLPTAVQAAVDCSSIGPIFKVAKSQDVRTGSGASQVAYAITAEDKFPGCAPEALNMTVVGIPLCSATTNGGSACGQKVNLANGEVGFQVWVYPYAPSSVTDAAYTVTDPLGHSATVTLPLRTYYNLPSPANTTPWLDPVSDISLNGSTSELKSFTIAVNDTVDRDLITTGGGLVIDGLPAGYSGVTYTRIGVDRIAASVWVRSSIYNKGVYLVHITGKDTRGGITLAQMRVYIY